MRIKVCQFKASPIAMAPDVLSDCINKYSTDFVSHVCGPRSINPTPQEGTALLHCHNKIPGNIRVANRIIQYHSEPFQVDLKSPVKTRLVIAQYHATLPEYRTCKLVRNIIDFNDPVYNYNRVDNKIRIGYSPSRTTKMGQWHDKGYDATIRILNSIKEKYPTLVDVDVIRKVGLNECIERKSKCNIIIDECVTSSYHRSGLEGLALGKLTICSLDPAIENVIVKATKTPTHPFVNVWIRDLQSKLEELIDGGIDPILENGRNSRQWMESYWKPQDIIKEFENIYKKST
jgi:hypothetical protein